MQRSLIGALTLSLCVGGGAVAASTPGPGPGSGSGPGSVRDADGTNVLIAGVDTRDVVPKRKKHRWRLGGAGCGCADVLMLVHLSADEKRMSVVSIMRDSYVKFAAHDHRRHSGKINAAYKHGGADLVVRTVEKATGLDVDHYIEADFMSFMKTVDRFGGGPVCSAEPVRDRNSGLKLPAGTHHVDGLTALRYNRARHIDPPGDGGRVRRQQKFLAGMLSELKAAGAFESPAAALRTAYTLAASLHTRETSLPDLVRIGLAVSQLPPDRIEFVTVPATTYGHKVKKWGETVLWDEDRAAALWSALRGDRALTGDRGIMPYDGVLVGMPPEYIKVRIDDRETAEALRDNGFRVAKGRPKAPDKSPGTRTHITYDPKQARYATTLAAALPGAKLHSVRGHGKVFDVRVGTERREAVRVTYDRSGVEGPPVTAAELECPTKGRGRARS